MKNGIGVPIPLQDWNKNPAESPTKLPNNLDMLESLTTPQYSEAMSESEKEEKRANFITKLYRKKFEIRDQNEEKEAKLRWKRSKLLKFGHIDDRVNADNERINYDDSMLMVYDEKPLVTFDAAGNPMLVHYPNTDNLPRLASQIQMRDKPVYMS